MVFLVLGGFWVRKFGFSLSFVFFGCLWVQKLMVLVFFALFGFCLMDLFVCNGRNRFLVLG